MLVETRARARWAVTTVFAVNGATIASLAVRNPSLKLDLALTPGQLGLTAVFFGVSALGAMQFAGRIAARTGSGILVRTGAVAVPLALLLVGAAPTFPALALALVVIGAVHGTLDVAMNAHGVAVERELGRPVMNGCHAAWSLGAVAGSLLGGLAASLDVPRFWHYVGIAAVAVTASLAVGPLLLPSTSDIQPVLSKKAPWTRHLVLIGALGAIVLTCEGAVINWSGIFLHENRGASIGLAAAGFIAFTAGQTGLRLVGDRISARYPAALIVRVGAVFGLAGLLIVLLVPGPVAAIAGFGVLGLGLATTLPVLYSVVGHQGGAATVARFTTMTYSGILIAPAVIGWAADRIGLPATLWALAPLLALVALLARRTVR